MASGTWNTGFWGQNQWNDSADSTFTVTGIALTASLGDETTVGEINTGWGRLAWNDSAWGIAGNLIAPGQALTGTLASVVASIDVSPGPSTNNNQLITTALNDVTVDIQTKAFPSGLPLTAAEGTADAGPDAMATGNAMSMGLGTVDAFNQTGWGRQGWNVNAWGVEGQFANVDLTGIAMTAAVSAPEAVKGDANLTLNTLNVAQATLGNVDPAPDASVTGNLAVANLGTAAGIIGYIDIPVTSTSWPGTPTAVPNAAVIGIPVGLAPAPAKPKAVPKFAIIGSPMIIASGAGSTLPKVA